MSHDRLAERFERIYAADPDPWEYRSSRYEDEKYERTLDALPARHMDRALELGCSIGVLTERLSRRCRELVAVDISQAAIEAARRRLAGAGNVRLIRGDLRDGIPAGPFDAVICSEILYYWEPADVVASLERIERELVIGGSLIAVNWLGADPEAPQHGDDVHCLLAARERLSCAVVQERPGYRLERWVRSR